MKRETLRFSILYPVIATAVTVFLFSAPAINAQKGENEYVQVNLVSSGYVPAKVTDPKLINPWGMVAGAATPPWVSDQGMNVATVYPIALALAGKGPALTVGIPTVAGPVNGPTGIVFNSNSNAFKIPGPMGQVPSLFIFANLNGTISAWGPASKGGLKNAVVALSNKDEDDPGAIFSGLALGTVGSNDYLYAADFRPNGGIRVFDKFYERAADFAWNAFRADDKLPDLPHGMVWAPYNIANIGGVMYVAYDAMPAAGGLPITHQGLGVIAIFKPNGEFIRIFARKGHLDAPWGMAMAPAGFGRFSNDILIGNFGNGRIHAYRPDGSFAGVLRDENHHPLENGFLWTLMFGNGALGSDPNTLYITTGGANQLEGLLAAISASK